MCAQRMTICLPATLSCTHKQYTCARRGGGESRSCGVWGDYRFSSPTLPSSIPSFAAAAENRHAAQMDMPTRILYIKAVHIYMCSSEAMRYRVYFKWPNCLPRSPKNALKPKLLRFYPHQRCCVNTILHNSFGVGSANPSKHAPLRKNPRIQP